MSEKRGWSYNEFLDMPIEELFIWLDELGDLSKARADAAKKRQAQQERSNKQRRR